MLYESFLLIAVLALVTLVFLLCFGDATQGSKRYLLMATLWLSMGLYFSWCWHRSGQTLAMKTWRVQLTTCEGYALSLSRAWLRYLLASIFFGATFLWALFDREGLFLHDRLSGCRLLQVPKTSA